MAQSEVVDQLNLVAFEGERLAQARSIQNFADRRNGGACRVVHVPVGKLIAKFQEPS